MEQDGNVNRERIVDDYKHSIIQSVEHDEMQHGDTAAEREQYSERTHQLDENEAVAKEQYDNNHCEEVTGLSSDGYRHQVIEDYTHEQMADKSAAENQGGNYWDDAAKEDGVTAESQNVAQSEQADYWSGNDVGNASSNENMNENENSISNEASC